MNDIEKTKNFMKLYNKLRKVWSINPKTRVKPKKKYNRSKNKVELKKIKETTLDE